MPVARLRLRIIATRTREDEEGNQQVSESFTQVESSLGRLARVAGRRGGLRLWHKAALLLSPALFTLGKHVIGMAAGLGVMGVVVGAAILPWVALAVTAQRNVSEMGPAGRKFVDGLAGVESAWFALARQTAHLTLGPVTDVLNGIAAAIPKLEPLVREVAPDFARMGRDIGAWLSGNGFDRFIKNVSDYGVPAFRNLVRAGRDFMATLGIGFRHFLPLADDIANTLRNGARDMRDAARGGGIGAWLKDWRANLPIANKFLREAGRTLNIMGQLLNDMGPGMLNGISAGLTAFNAFNPYVLMGIIAAYASGKAILGLVAALRMMQAIRALRAISFILQAGQLAAAATALTGATVVINGLAVVIGKLAAAIVALGRIRLVTTALDAIKKIWDSTPKNVTATLNLASVNLMIVAMMGLNSTWVTVQTRLAVPAAFTARADIGPAQMGMAAMGVAWGLVRIAGLFPALFSALSIPGPALASMTSIIAAWARVRVAAAVPALFSATASPGNVQAAGAAIIAAWQRVRVAASRRPFFVARSNSAPMITGARIIITAWMRVVGMMKLWWAYGLVFPGNVPGASSAIIGSWRRIYNLARSWHGVASCNGGGGFGGVSPPSGGGGGDMVPSWGGGRTQDLQGGTAPGFPRVPLDNYGTIDLPDYLGGGDPFYPDDFAGGFGQASGGLAGYPEMLSSSGPRLSHGMEGGKRTIHIYDDVWIRSHEDLVKILLDAS